MRSRDDATRGCTRVTTESYTLPTLKLKAESAVTLLLVTELVRGSQTRVDLNLLTQVSAIGMPVATNYVPGRK